jgi:hypothetical protein
VPYEGSCTRTTFAILLLEDAGRPPHGSRQGSQFLLLGSRRGLDQVQPSHRGTIASSDNKAVADVNAVLLQLCLGGSGAWWGVWSGCGVSAGNSPRRIVANEHVFVG